MFLLLSLQCQPSKKKSNFILKRDFKSHLSAYISWRDRQRETLVKKKFSKNNVKLDDVKTKTNLRYISLSSQNHVLKTIFNVLEPFINLFNLVVSLCNVRPVRWRVVDKICAPSIIFTLWRNKHILLCKRRIVLFYDSHWMRQKQASFLK